MKEINLYKYGLFFLLLINGVLLMLFIFGGPKNPNRNPAMNGKPPHELLQLDEKQNEQFFIKVKAHIKINEQILERQKKVRLALFSAIANENNQEKIAEVKNEIFQLEDAKVQAILTHFEEVKSILRKDQLENFEVFMKEVSNNIQTNKPPPNKKY